MADILNLALPYFGLIFIGFACGKSKNLPETGLGWMNFFLLYVSLPALLFGIMKLQELIRAGGRKAGAVPRPVNKATFVDMWPETAKAWEEKEK